jgi:hypothetical protein
MSKIKATPELQKEIVRLYRDEKKTGTAIARQLKIRYYTVSQTLDLHGIVQRNSRRSRSGRLYRNPLEIEAKIVEEYVGGASLDELAKKYGYKTHASVKGLLVRYDVAIRRQGSRRKITDQMVDEIATRYAGGETGSSIALDMKIEPGSVYRYLRSRGIDIRKTRTRGSESPNWKGGRTINAQGYVYVHLPENSPFAPMERIDGRIFEHRLVMAQHLGRPLLDSETVHHLDGNRKNNDISNLALHIGKHGAGQRYCCADCGSLRLNPIGLKE